MAKRIGLVVALDGEVKQMYATLGKVVCEEKIGGYTVTEFEYGSKELYLVWSGIGEISASMATQILILIKKVEIVINFGLVGALKSGYHCKDVVVVKEVVHYDYTLDLASGERGAYWFDRGNNCLTVSAKGYEDIVDSLSLRSVRIASGDKFVNVSDTKNWLVEKFDCDVCDMESAGITLACNFNKIPLIMLKAVSDNADEGANESFENIITSSVDYYIGAVHTILANIGDNKKSVILI